MIVLANLRGNIKGVLTALNTIDKLLQEEVIAVERGQIFRNVLKNVTIKLHDERHKCFWSRGRTSTELLDLFSDFELGKLSSVEP